MLFFDMFNNIIQLYNNQLTFVISYQIFRYKSFTERLWFMYKLNIYAMCLCMVDSETWLRNDPLVPYSCNLCKVTNVLFIIYCWKCTLKTTVN